jgi:hypothetical protein
VAIFMWSYVLFPAEFASGVDFKNYFYENRRWFFGIQTVVFLMDIPETLQKSVLHLRPVPAVITIGGCNGAENSSISLVDIAC